MNFKEQRDGNKLTVLVDGKIDSNSSPILTDYFNKELAGVQELTIDLEKVDYVSSAGLRTILVAQKIMDKQGKMYVAHVNSDIMETFELTCFTDFLNII